MNLVPELAAQLCKQAALDKGRGGCIDSWLALGKFGSVKLIDGECVENYLAARKTHGHNAELVGLGQELWLDHGWSGHRGRRRVRAAAPVIKRLVRG